MGGFDRQMGFSLVRHLPSSSLFLLSQETMDKNPDRAQAARFVLDEMDRKEASSKHSQSNLLAWISVAIAGGGMAIAAAAYWGDFHTKSRMDELEKHWKEFQSSQVSPPSKPDPPIGDLKPPSLGLESTPLSAKDKTPTTAEPKDQ